MQKFVVLTSFLNFNLETVIYVEDVTVYFQQN
jgi:hypothetical protein